MEGLVSIIALGSLAVAFIFRIYEEKKEAKKRERIPNRNNHSAWIRVKKR